MGTVINNGGAPASLPTLEQVLLTGNTANNTITLNTSVLGIDYFLQMAPGAAYGIGTVLENTYYANGIISYNNNNTGFQQAIVFDATTGDSAIIFRPIPIVVEGVNKAFIDVIDLSGGDYSIVNTKGFYTVTGGANRIFLPTVQGNSQIGDTLYLAVTIVGLGINFGGSNLIGRNTIIANGLYTLMLIDVTTMTFVIS